MAKSNIPVRKSSGAVVWRTHNGQREILLVRSTSGKSWCFPKGGQEKGLTKRQNATKEVWEEAGVIGHVGDEIARYRFMKEGVQQRVTMFEMECIAVLDLYPEAEIRARRWFSVADASAKLNAQLREVLEEAIGQLSEDENDLVFL